MEREVKNCQKLHDVIYGWSLSSVNNLRSVDDEGTVLRAFLPDAQEGEEPDPAVEGRLTAIDERDGDGGRSHGHADHLPLVPRDVVGQGVDRVVQYVHPARFAHLYRTKHSVKKGKTYTIWDRFFLLSSPFGFIVLCYKQS